MLELKDATLALGGHQLFDRLSLMAHDGQLTCITGPAGSGKTALVQVMLSFLPLDEGLVSIDGELLTPLSAPVFRQLMAYVPQRHEVAISPTTIDTTGLEAVWSPYNRRQYQPSPIDDHLDVAPLSTRPIVIVDDPDVSMLGQLKALVADNHVVIVATEREEYLSISNKIITLGRHDNFIS